MASAGEKLAITLYSKPGCVQCTSSYRALDSAGIEYTVLDVTEVPNAEARVRELGYQALPVIDLPFDYEIYDENGERIQHWYGFRPDLIAKLAA